MWFHVPFRQILHKFTRFIVVKIRGIPRIQLQAVYTAAHFRKWSVNCESTVRFRAVENSQLRVVSFESDSLRVRLHGHQLRVHFRKWVAFESEAIVRTRQQCQSARPSWSVGSTTRYTLLRNMPVYLLNESCAIQTKEGIAKCDLHYILRV